MLHCGYALKLAKNRVACKDWYSECHRERSEDEQEDEWENTWLWWEWLGLGWQSQCDCDPTSHLQVPDHLSPSSSVLCFYLHLPLAVPVHISFSRSLFWAFLGRHLLLLPCGVHCIACLTMLSTHLFPFSFFLAGWMRASGQFCLYSLLAVLFG